MYQTNVFPVDQVSKFQGDTNFRKHVKTLLQFEPQKLTQVNSAHTIFFLKPKRTKPFQTMAMPQKSNSASASPSRLSW